MISQLDLTGHGEADVPDRRNILCVPEPAFLPTYPQLAPLPQGRSMLQKGGGCGPKEQNRIPCTLILMEW